MVHGWEEAERVEDASAVLFTEKIADLDGPTLEGALGDAPSTPVSAPNGWQPGCQYLMACALVGPGAASNRDARQLLSQNSVSVNGKRISEDRLLTLADAIHGRWIVLRRGRANQHVLVVTDTA